MPSIDRLQRKAVYAIKTEVADPSAASWDFHGQKTMYGGRNIAPGDRIFIFASENEGGAGLIAVGVVASADPLPRKEGVERQTPRVSISVRRTGSARRRLGRTELKPFRDWGDGRPETELNFKFYRQATNKIVGLSEEAAEFLAGYFQRQREEKEVKVTPDPSVEAKRSGDAMGALESARRIAATLLAVCALTSHAAVTPNADPNSDAPEHRPAAAEVGGLPGSYEAALGSWRTAEDINAWIGARFEYDLERAARLSESQRAQAGRVPIHAPDAFFANPSGVCVDLARFAVETLRAVDPASRPAYLMIEFDPVVISGNTLRRHWVASFRRDGKWHFFADSKRPGHVAGPYETVRQFIDEYAGYRGRRIVSYRELESYERKLKKQAGLPRRADGLERQSPQAPPPRGASSTE